LSLHEAGFEVLPIKWQGNRHEAAIPMLDRDLTDKGQQDQTMKDIAKAEFVHAVPPCGTASAARNQKSLVRFKKFGIKEPQPLRTKEFQKGKPHLNATDRIEVTKANQIYEFIAKVMNYCCLWGSHVQWKSPRILCSGISLQWPRL